MHCKVWISALCSFLLSLSPQHYANAFQPWDSKPWLSLYTTPQRLKPPSDVGGLDDIIEDVSNDAIRINSQAAMKSQEDFLPWESQDEEEEEEEQVRRESGISNRVSESDISNRVPKLPDYRSARSKRVFLSRGWMAGGYKAPEPSPNRFVRRPPAMVPMQPTFPQPKTGDGPDKEVHYAALVSDQPQQSPPYRRFHSIFTSGMWTPLGKRSQEGNPFQRQVVFYI